MNVHLSKESMFSIRLKGFKKLLKNKSVSSNIVFDHLIQTKDDEKTLESPSQRAGIKVYKNFSLCFLKLPSSNKKRHC